MTFFVASLIFLIAGVVIGLIGRYYKQKLLMAGGFAGGVVLCAALLTLSCVNSVPTGHTGVVTTFGRVENYTLDSGIHFTLPWQEVVKMDNRVQKQTVDLSCFSSDIQEVALTYTINYQIKKSDAMTIYSSIGTDYYNTVIMPSVAESVKVVTARYTAENLVGQRSDLAAAIESDLAEKLIRYNIEVVSTSIENMDFTDAFTNAVEEKQVAQQNKLRAETEAEQKVIEAEAAAQVKKVEADADAYEVQARARAEAEANQKLADSLTDTLISYIYAQNWNGELPRFMSGENGMVPVFDFGNAGTDDTANNTQSTAAAPGKGESGQ